MDRRGNNGEVSGTETNSTQTELAQGIPAKRLQGDLGESQSPPVHAAIDIGTNSIHMVIARTVESGGFDVLTAEKEMVRLGEGSTNMKELSPAAIERGVAALGRMVGVAASYDAIVSAVATSAVREASNGAEFINRVRAETGLEIEVISGFEEARLIHLGVLQALPVYNKQLMLVDIGGGSTEFLVGLGNEVKAARSIKLGAIRISNEFFPDGDATAKSVKKCRKYLRNALAAAVHELAQFDFDIAIGTSGTISSLASIIDARRESSARDLNGVKFTRQELDDVIDQLVASTSKDRTDLPGLDERRSDIITGGAILLSEIFSAFSIETMTISTFALREGVLLDRAETLTGASNRLADLRRANARRLAQQLDPDAQHAETAARLALQIFDQTKDLHKLGRKARELLEMAAIVHNVGLFISHAAHHKHTYYVVRHSEQLTGFTERERELLALIARYHRRGHPSSKHAEFDRLSEKDQETVRKLAGILRVAIGLDRSHRALVSGVVVSFDKLAESLSIEALVRTGQLAEGKSDNGRPDQARPDIQLELYSAQERSDLLSLALGIDVEVTGADTDHTK